MHKDRIAEWVLALVTSRERAASTVGDLMEGAATRGGRWFWSSVLRTTASLLWDGFAADPGKMLGLAFRGWLLGLVLLFACFLGTVLLFGIPYLIVVVWIIGSRALPGGLARFLIEAAGFGGAMLCQFQVGRWIARRAPGPANCLHASP